ncbi:MAG: hypothetical protein F6K35_04110 [Okeania sp. SIO2H7]|nr:hypothetical protein [Okeania sp. SIO2H7]
MVFSSSTADFGFKIDFARNTEDPARIFRALSELIKFCEITDQTLIKYLDIDVKYKLILDDIEEGSLIVWLKYAFDSINEKINLKLIYSYLVSGKSCIIEFVQQKNTINRSELINLQERLHNSAKETKTNPFDIYIPVKDKDLVLSLDSFQSAVCDFQDLDKLYYLIGESNVSVNQNFGISDSQRESLLVKDKKTSTLEMILKVKKPDYLGESKWQFKDKRRTIEVKITDSDWLESFQKNREFSIKPGDAIKAEVEVTSKYGFSGELLSTEYVLKKVIEVVSMHDGSQLSLFKDKDQK